MVFKPVAKSKTINLINFLFGSQRSGSSPKKRRPVTIIRGTILRRQTATTIARVTLCFVMFSWLTFCSQLSLFFVVYDNYLFCSYCSEVKVAFTY